MGDSSPGVKPALRYATSDGGDQAPATLRVAANQSTIHDPRSTIHDPPLSLSRLLGGGVFLQILLESFVLFFKLLNLGFEFFRFAGPFGFVKLGHQRDGLLLQVRVGFGFGKLGQRWQGAGRRFVEITQ